MKVITATVRVETPKLLKLLPTTTTTTTTTSSATAIYSTIRPLSSASFSIKHCNHHHHHHHIRNIHHQQRQQTIPYSNILFNSNKSYSTMSDKKTIVVFGATGSQGGSVIKSLLEDPATKDAFHIKGVTRDPTKPSAQSLKDKGVEPIKADLNDTTSLQEALKGAWGVFAVTNYWDTMNKDGEVAQGKAIADAAKSANVSRLVWSSLINVEKTTKGALPHVYHFDSKNDVEQYIRDQNIPATYFYPGFYMSNFFGPGPMQIKSNNGVYGLSAPLPSDGIFPLFDVNDTGKYVKPIFKQALTNPSALLHEKVLSGQYVTATEVLDTIVKVVGKGETKWNEISKEEFMKFFPEQMPAFAKEELAENFMLLDKKFGYYGGEDLAKSLALLEEKPVSWEEYVRENKDKLE